MSNNHVGGGSSGMAADMDSSQDGQIPIIDFTKMTHLRQVQCGGMARISLYESQVPGLPSLVAKKSLFNGSLSTRFEAQLRSEMAILHDLNHDNIVKTYGVVETGHDFGLVMEYLELGSYQNFFNALRGNAVLTQDFEKRIVPLKVRILDEITDAMKYLHGCKPKKVLHLDLKSDNVLLDNSLHSKICDFGLSRMTTLTTLRNSTAVEGVPGGRPSGTPGHIAPERLRNAREKPTTKTDVYSFGILEWEILTHRVPYEEIGQIDYNVLKNQIVDDNMRPLEDVIPEIYKKSLPELLSMMKTCWSGNPSERPSFESLHSDLKALEGRIPEFDKQANASARKTLDLYKTSYRSKPTNASISEPQNRHVRVVTGSSLPRQASSMPANTIPKHVYHPSLTTEQAEPTETILEKRPMGTDFPGENDPLLPKPEVETGFCSTRKVLFIIFLVSITVIGSVVGGVLTSMSGKSLKGCSSLLPPPHGAMKCTSDKADVSQSCTFTCSKGYLPRGPDKVTCVDGKWNNKPPICSPSCTPLKPVEFGEFTCTDGSFQNSSCNFTCVDNHEIHGSSTLTCESDVQWSHPEPTCVCPKCTIGDKCQYSVDWHNVANVLDQMQLGTTLTVHYGEQEFTCTVMIYTVLPQFTYMGKCIDAKTGSSAQCPKYVSARVSAKHAAAQLVRNMVSQKAYPEPCDPADMDTGC